VGGKQGTNGFRGRTANTDAPIDSTNALWWQIILFGHLPPFGVSPDVPVLFDLWANMILTFVKYQGEAEVAMGYGRKVGRPSDSFSSGGWNNVRKVF